MGAHIELTLNFIQGSETISRKVTINKAVVGGWTGRDKAALQHHIDELGKIGVKPPTKTPLFYRVGVSRVVTSDAIEVIGDGSSGEVEYVLLKTGGKLWIGAGSDHTDRVVEHMGITVAKQLCDKPVATTFWAYDEVVPHWDQLILRSYIEEDGKTVLYQEGNVTGLLTPEELLAEYHRDYGELEDDTLMFGGTTGAIGEVRYAPSFELQLEDPVLNRSIKHNYQVIPVPILG